jgi:hypothetical protein
MSLVLLETLLGGSTTSAILAADTKSAKQKSSRMERLERIQDRIVQTKLSSNHLRGMT